MGGLAVLLAVGLRTTALCPVVPLLVPLLVVHAVQPTRLNRSLGKGGDSLVVRLI